MRDYTYLDGARFTIANIYRSLRFDVDRLDLSWVDEEKPSFVRGYRIVDNEEVQTYTVNSEDADNLVFSLTYLHCRNDNFDSFRVAVDRYLVESFETKEYLITNQKKDLQEKTDSTETVLH